jgi:hypothetical protein
MVAAAATVSHFKCQSADLTATPRVTTYTLAPHRESSIGRQRSHHRVHASLTLVLPRRHSDRSISPCSSITTGMEQYRDKNAFVELLHSRDARSKRVQNHDL